jgi:hypothetical protein
VLFHVRDSEGSAVPLDDVRAATLELSRAGLLPETVIVTAGGSA